MRDFDCLNLESVPVKEKVQEYKEVVMKTTVGSMEVRNGNDEDSNVRHIIGKKANGPPIEVAGKGDSGLRDTTGTQRRGQTFQTVS